MSNPYAFTSEHYMKMKLRQMTCEIPQDIMDIIKDELNKKNITNPSIRDIRKILINHKLYGHIDSIHNILAKLTNPLITVDNEECCICYETVTQVVKLECTHSFCKECSTKISENGTIKCPLCRNNQIYVDQIIIDEIEQKEILDTFRKNKNNYKIGINYVPFDSIIKDIRDSKK